MAGAPGSTFSAITHELHRQRRGVLNPFFLKRTIAKSESQITEKVSQLCRRFEEYSVSKEPLHLDAAISALVSSHPLSWVLANDKARHADLRGPSLDHGCHIALFIW